MPELLIYLEKATFNILFFVTVVYVLSRPRNISVLITIITVFLTELFLIQLEPLLFDDVQWSDPIIHRVAWFSLFSGMEALAAFGIVQLHKIYDERFSVVARKTINIYLLLSMANVAFFCISFFITQKNLHWCYALVTGSLFFTMLFILFYHVVKNLELKQLITRWRNQA